MCMICNVPSDFDFKHMEAEIKKLKREELFEAAKKLKHSIRTYEIWALDQHSSGYEIEMVKTTLEYLKQAQYILNRYM